MKEKPIRKKQGFDGQRLVVIPAKIDKEILQQDPITRQIYITDIGYYPKASQHHIERPRGIDQHIIIYCVEGQGWVTVNKKKLSISSSSFIVIPANMAHKYGADETDPWTIYWLHFKGDIATFVVDLITNNSQNYLPYLSYHDNRIRLFDEIYSNLENGFNIDNLRYANMLFHHFISSLLYEEKFNVMNISKGNDPVVAVIELMKKSLHQNISLAEFAGQSNLSVSHFCNMFRLKTGFAPIEYFNHLKMQQACQILAFSKTKIKQIAADLAFTDQYYFSRIFSRYMGVSPLEYRRKAAQKQ